MSRVVRIRVLSDLHLEFAPFTVPEVPADVVVLAGDIGVGTAGLEWAADVFAGTPIVYVPGNHEFYRHDVRELRPAMRRAAGELGIYLLEDASVVLHGVRFLGATLWTDFLACGPGNEWFAQSEARRGMADFHVVTVDGQRLTPAQTARWHDDSRAWLARELAAPFVGPTVVVTHHLPTLRSVAPRFARSLLTPAFASRCDELVAQADVWIHGHTHDAFDYEHLGCRVVCNPRGYPGELADGRFDAGKVVELERAPESEWP